MTLHKYIDVYLRIFYSRGGFIHNFSNPKLWVIFIIIFFIIKIKDRYGPIGKGGRHSTNRHCTRRLSAGRFFVCPNSFGSQVNQASVVHLCALQYLYNT